MRFKQPTIWLILPVLLLSCDERNGGKEQPQQSQAISEACNFPEAHQFDFWLGDWELSWGDSGQGSNSITRILGGCIIQEHFSGGGLEGISVSAYNRQGGLWKQTWVDNNGVYLDFTGGLVDGQMILSRETSVKGEPAIQRMVWYNIDTDSLDWNWELSTDGGQTWKVNWAIDYKRKR